MNQKEKTAEIILVVIGGAAIVWLGLLTAPYIKTGFIGIVKNLGDIMEKPFTITWCEDSLKTILVFLVVYLLGIPDVPLRSVAGRYQSQAELSVCH